MRRRMGQLWKALARQEGGAAEGVPRAAVSYRDAAGSGWDRESTALKLTPTARLRRCSLCKFASRRQVRKLRWGYTLKKDAPGAYRLDMTEARFKNSRFYVRLQQHLQPLEPTEPDAGHTHTFPLASHRARR